MAINTIKATMQMRHGNEPNFDPDQMTAGEWAVSTDSKKVWMCFAPGIVRRMATYEGFEKDMEEIQKILKECQDIQIAVDAMANLAEQHKNEAKNAAKLSESWAHGNTGVRPGEDTNSSKYWSQQSKNEADRAKDEADRAASIAGIDVDSSLSETSTNPVQNKVVTAEINKKVSSDGGDASNLIANFVQALSRTNINSGETLETIFGKIKKWFGDLKTVAFSGNYNDLSNKPSIPSAVRVKGNAESAYRTGDVNLTPDNIGAIATSKIVKSTNITQEGFLMDGKTASDALTELNKNKIIEVGSNSKGHYRKYANGTLEMWGEIELISVSIAGSNGLFFYAGTLQLPYTSITGVIAQLVLYTNGGAWATGSTGGNGKSTIGYFLRQSVATTITGRLHFHCFGTWK